jgi:hypothetical protein
MAYISVNERQENCNVTCIKMERVFWILLAHTVTSSLQTTLIQFHAVNLRETLLRQWCKMSTKTYNDHTCRRNQTRCYSVVYWSCNLLITILYVFFWVFPWRQIVICRRFGTLCQFHLSTLHPAFEDGTDRGFRNVGRSQSDAREIPKRTHTIL